ncbi:adenylate/guanylate cyclase domain-containing protein [Cyanobium sp. CH-040]|uniref:adenylate/guanylate cyclase domain-containing protein n=1 Tax=Cyanobium sp. CH-040 TaxID=2823708 RepID=UPI0020CDBB47|nr:adenylate/guanylate cyclase domain-containing protein [Cyanobium sp. CH-040]MCP9928352.1 adenylate/guanylate cyclase domain-containing protein [Cyanobium sp. CH-040]
MVSATPLRQGWRVLLLAALVGAPWLEAGDGMFSSVMFRLRGPRRPPPELVILDVDQDSVALADRLTPEEIAASPLWRRMGPWPWPRQLQADLAAAVLDQGARQVVFTLLYPHPSHFGAADDRAFLQRLTPWRDRVVLVAGYGAETDPATGVDLVRLRRPVYSLGGLGHDALLEGATGAIEALPGRRWQRQALAEFPPPHPPALAFAAAARQPPLSPLGLDFIGPAGSVAVVPAWQVQQQPPGFWRDRIVLLGRTPSRLSDRRPSPYGPLSSVELQAAALATVLQDRGFRSLPGLATVVVLLGWGGLGLALLGRPALAAGTATTAVLLAVAALAAAALAWLAGWWLPVSALVAAPLLGGGGRALGQWRLENRERTYLHQVLACRVSPALLADILREPGPLGTQLGGSRARCAVLFTDLVDFTPLSAQLEPAELFALLNRYFETIASAVIAENGLLDKFIGDALMAEFGVPRSRGDAEEARAAVRAALAMQASLARLNADLAAQGLPSLHQGIGIHLGEVIAGNLGSSQRLEYTVIGASVNLASRLEGLTRQFPQFPVLISGAVLAALPGQLDVEPLGEHRLKGWPEPVAVYGLRGMR